MTDEEKIEGEEVEAPEPEKEEEPEHSALRKEMMSNVKDNVERRGTKEVIDELRDAAIKSDYEIKMRKLEEQYAKLHKEFDGFKNKMLKKKVQGKATLFDEKKKKSADLKEVYPELDEMGLIPDDA
jgi:hypothetical protein